MPKFLPNPREFAPDDGLIEREVDRIANQGAARIEVIHSTTDESLGVSTRADGSTTARGTARIYVHEAGTSNGDPLYDVDGASYRRPLAAKIGDFLGRNRN